jgi:hypothetical protein
MFGDATNRRLVGESTIMTRLANGAEVNMAVLAVYNLKKLACEISTGVDGVVAWLQSSYNPVDAMDKLLEQPADLGTHNPQADISNINDLSWVS